MIVKGSLRHQTAFYWNIYIMRYYMDTIFSSLPVEKINEDKTLDLQETQQIYNFLLTNDY